LVASNRVRNGGEIFREASLCFLFFCTGVKTADLFQEYIALSTRQTFGRNEIVSSHEAILEIPPTRTLFVRVLRMLTRRNFGKVVAPALYRYAWKTGRVRGRSCPPEKEGESHSSCDDVDRLERNGTFAQNLDRVAKARLIATWELVSGVKSWSGQERADGPASSTVIAGGFGRSVDERLGLEVGFGDPSVGRSIFRGASQQPDSSCETTEM